MNSALTGNISLKGRDLVLTASQPSSSPNWALWGAVGALAAVFFIRRP